MRRHVKGLVLVLVGAVLATGCAKEGTIKKDEAIAPAATTKVAPAASAKAEPVKAEPAREASVKETALQPVAAGELKEALEAIYFNFDSVDLSSQSRDILTKNAELLKSNTAAKVRIEGNCDERGSDEYNLALGERRARAAKQYLTTMGVAANRISTISYGKEKPADPGHNETAWEKNRRDEFVLNAN